MRCIRIILIALWLIIAVNAIPRPAKYKYNHMGLPPVGSARYNNSLIKITDESPYQRSQKTAYKTAAAASSASTASSASSAASISSAAYGSSASAAASTSSAVPQFYYVQLGQDPKDQQWYRIGLKPTNNNVGYEAQIATRKTPPYVEQQAHKHDKTIANILHWLQSTETQSLVRAYKDLLKNVEDDDYVIQEESKSKPCNAKKDSYEKLYDDNKYKSSNTPKNKVEKQYHLAYEQEKNKNKTVPITHETEEDPKGFNNFLYFIKGLK